MKSILFILLQMIAVNILTLPCSAAPADDGAWAGCVSNFILPSFAGGTTRIGLLGDQTKATVKIVFSIDKEGKALLSSIDGPRILKQITAASLENSSFKTSCKGMKFNFTYIFEIPNKPDQNLAPRVTFLGPTTFHLLFNRYDGPIIN